MPGPYLNVGPFRSRVTDTHAIGPQEELGVWRFEAGKIYRYVKFGALIPAFEACRLDSTVTTAALFGNQVLQTSAATDMFMGIAEVTGPNLAFGWITAYGNATGRVAGEAAGSALGPSANTGVLSIRNTSHFNTSAIAAAAGLSMGSAVFIHVL